MSRVKVTLREKKINNGKFSLYLDFYPPIINSDGKRTRREFLGMYIYEKPKNAQQRKENQEQIQIASQIRDQRNIQLINKEYGFKDNFINNRKLTDIYSDVVDDKLENNSRSNYLAWKASLKVFKNYFKDKTSHELNKYDVESYRDYILKYKSIKTKSVIKKSTASTYFKHFLYVLKHAYRNKLIKEDLAAGTKHINYESEPREYLNYDEIKALKKTPLEIEAVKDISFLMLLTGKRFVEIINLRWSDIGNNSKGEYFLKIKETKNEKYYNHPISNEAYKILTNQPKTGDKIFTIDYTKAHKVLKKWLVEAEITKDIGFHNFRHTYATLQLENGTDIYTLSSLLGHKNIKTTQVYGKVTDKRKSETINKIKIDGL